MRAHPTGSAVGLEALHTPLTHIRSDHFTSSHSESTEIRRFLSLCADGTIEVHRKEGAKVFMDTDSPH